MKKFVMMWVLLLMTGGLLAQQQDRVQDRDQLRREDHLVMRDGNMYLIQDQERIRLTEQYQLNNGTIVFPDGSYQLKNQKQFKLNEGELLNMEGKLYRNQQAFRKDCDRYLQRQEQRQMRQQDKLNRKGNNQRGGRGGPM